MPPNHSGMGRCTGNGLMPAALTVWKRPRYVTTSSVHSSRMSSTCSSMILPRWWKSTPSASYSTSFQPVATTSRSLPPESTSTSAACLANKAV